MPLSDAGPGARVRGERGERRRVFAVPGSEPLEDMLPAPGLEVDLTADAHPEAIDLSAMLPIES